MNDELQEALLAIITGTINAASAAKAFLMSELPDVIHQLLLWKAVASGLRCGLFLVLAIATGVAAWVLLKKAVNYVPKSRYDDGAHLCIPGVICAVVCPVVFFVGVCTNFTWLQILIAPKIYLIEYAASLVKG